MKKVFYELGFLLVHGRINSTRSDSVYQRLNLFLRLCILGLLFSFVASIIKLCFFEFYNIAGPSNVFFDSLKKEALSYQFALACLYAPIVEELEFRIFLKYSKINFTAFLGIWFYHLVREITYGNTLFGAHSDVSVSIGIVLGFVGLAYSFLDKNKVVNDYLGRFWSKWYKSIFYFSVIGFGFIHIFNFDTCFSTLLLTPVLTLPQTSIGLLLGYIRLKYGILYAMLLHSAYNFSLFIIQIIVT
jgi:hypothetical protein